MELRGAPSSDTTENYDMLFPDQAVVDQYLPIWACHNAFANKPAFRWVDILNKETKSLTYAELNLAASAIARQLREDFGLSHGDRIMAVYPPGLEFIELLFGSQRAGLVLVPVSQPEPASFSEKKHQNLVRQIKNISPKLILTVPEFLVTLHNLLRNYKPPANYGHDLNYLVPGCALASLRNVALYHTQQQESVLWRESDKNSPVYSNGNFISTNGSGGNSFISRDGCQSLSPMIPYTGCKPEDIYLIQYTSGATGDPKAATLTAGAAAHNVRAVRTKFDFQPSSLIVSWLPTYHDCGLMLVLSTVVSGATMIATSPFSFVQRPVLWLQMISEYGATSTVAPAFALPLTSKKFEIAKISGKVSWRMDLSHLKNVMVVNEPISRILVDEFVQTFAEYGLQGQAMAPSYGMAEMCTYVSSSWDSSLSKAMPLPTCGGLVASGKVEHGFDIRIVDPETRIVLKDGHEGEVWVASASKTAGYLDNPFLTTRDIYATLARHSPSEKRDGQQQFFRTGDFGRVLDGYLFVTGRLADVMFLNGRLWHPHHLELSVSKSAPELRPGCSVAFSLIPGMAGKDSSQKNELVILTELITECPSADLTDRIHLVLRLRHGVEATVIGLLKRFAIPKTTSGKLRRQECRRKFLANEFQFVERRSYTSCSTFSGGRELTLTSSLLPMSSKSRVMAAL